MVLVAILLLCLLHVVTIAVIRTTSGDVFADPKADLQTVMWRLRDQRPVAYRIYCASLLLPLVYLVLAAVAKSLGVVA